MKYLRSKAAAVVYSVLIFCFITFHFADGSVLLFSPPSGRITESDTAVPYTFMLISITVLCMYFLKYVRGKRGVFFCLTAGAVSLGYSLVSFAGKCYDSDSKLELCAALRQSKGFFKAGICILGGWLLFFAVLMGLDMLRGRVNREKTRSGDLIGRIQGFLFGRHCFAKQCLILGLCWLPHILLRYPGALAWDGKVALYQYYGIRRYTTQHPIIYTILIGKLTKLGAKLGDPNYGLFLLVLLQAVLLVLAFSYMILTMRQLKMPYWCCTFALIMCAATPNAVAFATSIQIDALYLAAFTALLTEMCRYLYETERYLRSWRHLLLTAAAVAGTFFRYNGIYIAGALLVMILFREICSLLKKRRKLVCSLALVFAFLIPLFAGKVGVKYLNESHHTKSLGNRAMFALPIQQTARYMVFHSEDLTEEELEAYQKVMKIPVEEYEKRYRAYNFDGLKSGFNRSATLEEIKDFLGVWIKMLSRHPVTCLNATLRQNYLLFSPLLTNGKFHENQQKLSGIGKMSKDELFIDNSGNALWMRLRDDLYQYYHDFLQSPVGGVLMSAGWYTLLLLGLFLYAFCERNRELLFMGIPSLLTFAIIFAGPAIYGHQRYMLPIFYTMSLLLGIFASGRGSEQENAAEAERD